VTTSWPEPAIPKPGASGGKSRAANQKSGFPYQLPRAQAGQCAREPTCVAAAPASAPFAHLWRRTAQASPLSGEARGRA
jgi:hypothetical protein